MSFLLLFVLLVGLLSGGPRSGIDDKLESIVKPHLFSIAGWEVNALLRDELPSLLSREPSLDVSGVIRYFRLAGEDRDLAVGNAGSAAEATGLRVEISGLHRQKEELSHSVEKTIERQISEVLREQGIYSPFAGMHLPFPPVNFKLSETPNLLVISPRGRIESIDQAMLQTDLTTAEAEGIESRVDGLDLSSLVTRIGGLGATYPTFVADDMDLRATIETAAHEWAHQYLAFKPLGARYVLDLTGLTHDPDITRLNETAADVVGKEIGDLVYEKYYRDQLQTLSNQPPAADEAVESTAPGFDFNAEMRQTRLHVDKLLFEGKVTEAEQYMNERRDDLEQHGYYIRKLNQAYFAFYGSYADSPASVDPIGAAMMQLRQRSGSLERFLERVSSIVTERGLEDSAGG
jgi:hypothetical protein